jgi:hypothetical protein
MLKAVVMALRQRTALVALAEQYRVERGGLYVSMMNEKGEALSMNVHPFCKLHRPGCGGAT